MDKKPPVGEFVPVVKSLWKLIETIYTLKWDLFVFDKEASLTIQKSIKDKIVPIYRKIDAISSKSANSKENPTSLNSTVSLPKSAVSPPPIMKLIVPISLNNNVETVIKKVPKPSNIKKLYVQTSKSNISCNIEDVLRVKEAFPSLLANEVEKMWKVKNSGKGNRKPKINMPTRGPLRKKVIISIAKTNAELIINLAHIYISNVNKCLKFSKSDIITDFICVTNNGIIITMNKLANVLDLSTIKKYLKSIENVNSDSIEGPCLPKFKSYMKIIGLPYKTNQGVITSDYIEGILKELHLFKDVILVSKPCVIKVSPKSNMAVVWVDIWDFQSSSSAKNIINQIFFFFFYLFFWILYFFSFDFLFLFI